MEKDGSQDIYSMYQGIIYSTSSLLRTSFGHHWWLRYLMRPRADRRKLRPTMTIVQGFNATFVFLLLSSARAAHEEQIPEVMASHVAVEHEENTHAQVDVDERGSSTLAREKAAIEDTSRGTNSFDTQALNGPMDLEKYEEYVLGERNPPVSHSNEEPHQQQQQLRQPFNHGPEADGGRAHEPSASIAPSSEDDGAEIYVDVRVDAECEDCIGDEDSRDGDNVRESKAPQGSSGRANGPMFEQTDSEGLKEGGDQQGLEGDNEGMWESELWQALGSPTVVSVEQDEQAVRLSADVSEQANYRDASGGHVHESRSVDEEDRGGPTTANGRTPFDAPEISGGARDHAHVRDTTVAVEAVVTASIHYPKDPNEYPAFEHKDTRDDVVFGSGATSTIASGSFPRGGFSVGSPSSDNGGSGEGEGGVHPSYVDPSRDSALRDSSEVRITLEDKSSRWRETPHVTTSDHWSNLSGANDAPGVGVGAVPGEARGREGESEGSSAGSGIGFARGSSEDLAQRVKDMEAELTRKLLAEEDIKSLLDIWVERTREFILTRTIPLTDAECDFNWSRLRCEPKCLCGTRLRFGDYTPGRSCRLLHPWERSPGCEDALDPSDEPALRRLCGAMKLALGAAKRAYDARVAPPTDPECSFDLETRRCEPQPRCRFKFHWGDITLSSACRLA